MNPDARTPAPPLPIPLRSSRAMLVAMVTDSDTLDDDACALKQRRANLRAFVVAVAEATQAIPQPKTYLEAERACRAVTVADAFTAWAPPLRYGEDEDDPPPVPLDPVRRDLRRYADDLMEATDALDLPTTFIESFRAGRYAMACDRMLTQLYSRPKPSHFVDDDAEARAAHDRNLAFVQREFAKIDQSTAAFARQCGVWHDGVPCTPEDPRRLDFDAIDVQIMKTPWQDANADPNADPDADPDMSDDVKPASDPFILRIASLWVSRLNRIARAFGDREGVWPDGSAYAPVQPDLFCISTNYIARFTDATHKISQEGRRPEERNVMTRAPWWIVRRPFAPGEPRPTRQACLAQHEIKYPP